jgi:hypothetical protein
MPRYFLSFQGYTIHPDNLGCRTRTEARKQLRQAAREELRDARRAGWKSAAIIAKTPDHRAIQANRQDESPLWARIAVISV